MIRRPKPFEREEDLLSLQEEFLLSKSQPSASLVDKKLEGRKKERDVVSLEGKSLSLLIKSFISGPSKVISEVENVKPGTSKFKQRHEVLEQSNCISNTLHIILCTHTHTHTHTHTYTYIHTHVRIHAYIHTHMYAYTHTYMHTHTHVHIHTHAHTYTHTCTHTHIHTYIHTHTCTHTYIHTHTQKSGMSESKSSKF